MYRVVCLEKRASENSLEKCVGERLREERKRLGSTQDELAQVGGVNRNTQSSYEKADRSPDAKYLAAVAEIGVDVLYVVTGQRLPIPSDSLSADEAALLTAYRQVNDDDRPVLVRIATVFAKAPRP